MNFKMKHRPLLLSENNINSCNQSIKAGMKNKHRVKVLLKIIKSWLDITSVIVQIWEPDEDKASRFTCFGCNQFSIGSWQAHWSFSLQFLSCGMATLFLIGESVLTNICRDHYIRSAAWECFVWDQSFSSSFQPRPFPPLLWRSPILRFSFKKKMLFALFKRYGIAQY